MALMIRTGVAIVHGLPRRLDTETSTFVREGTSNSKNENNNEREPRPVLAVTVESQDPACDTSRGRTAQTTAASSNSINGNDERYRTWDDIPEPLLVEITKRAYASDLGSLSVLSKRWKEAVDERVRTHVRTLRITTDISANAFIHALQRFSAVVSVALLNNTQDLLAPLSVHRPKLEGLEVQGTWLLNPWAKAEEGSVHEDVRDAVAKTPNYRGEPSHLPQVHFDSVSALTIRWDDAIGDAKGTVPRHIVSACPNVQDLTLLNVPERVSMGVTNVMVRLAHLSALHLRSKFRDHSSNSKNMLFAKLTIDRLWPPYTMLESIDFGDDEFPDHYAAA
eukprot:TRINITY_DN27006_c0_g1_i1.p1 TRINITY_DN27006_c0_g1~~TRINITY_DN27006_c0_g1_i1.p1  ORF type:complete len:336 (+),score=18.52 TRINITY_DN27006_c0_g1_i1:100-1107(+)